MLLIQTILQIHRPIESNNWVIYILFVSLLVIAVCKFIFPKNVAALTRFDDYININENQGMVTIVSFILFAVLLGTILVPTLTLYFLPESNNIYKIGIVSILLLLFVLLKSGIRSFILFAFNTPIKFSNSLKIATFFRCYSVLLLWFAIALYYFSSTPKEIILVSVVIAIIITRVLQLYFNHKKQNLGTQGVMYYNILYLCTLEILPLLVIIKTLTS